MQKLTKVLSYILSLSLIVFLLPISNAQAAPTYNYEQVHQSGTVSDDGLAHEYTNLEAGQALDLSLTLFNRSGNTIQSRHRLNQPSDKQVPIGSYGIGSQTPYQDGTPHFLDTSSYVLNNNRFVYYEGEDVSDNGLITMNWTIKLKDNLSDGVYNLYVRPVSEYLAWTRQVKNGKLLPTTSSDIFWRLTVGEGTTEYITYTDEEYGFSLEYPSVGWSIRNAYSYWDRNDTKAMYSLGADNAQDRSAIIVIFEDTHIIDEVDFIRRKAEKDSISNPGYTYDLTEKHIYLNGVSAQFIEVKNYYSTHTYISHYYITRLLEDNGGYTVVLSGGYDMDNTTSEIIGEYGLMALRSLKSFKLLSEFL